MSKLIIAFKQLDFLSEKPTLYINKMERPKSFIGAMLTSLMVLLTVFFAIFNLVKLFVRTEVDFNITELREDLDCIIKIDKDFPIFFQIRQVNPNNPAFNPNDLFKISVNLYSVTQQYDALGNLLISQTKTAIAYAPCDGSNFSGDEILPSNFKSFYCLLGDYGKYTLLTNGSEENYLSVSVSLNNANSSIFKSNYFEFVFGYFNRFIDTHNLDITVVPLKYSILNRIKLTDTIRQNLDLTLINAKYITDNGHFIQDPIKFDMVLVDKSMNSISDVGSDKLIAEINLRANGMIKRELFRKFYKAQSFLAEIGGIFSILYIIAFNLNLLHSFINFNLIIDKECRVSYYAEKVINNNFRSLRLRK
jgi:hypothetical protein